MKFVVLALLVVSALADDIDQDPIDSSSAVRRSELPGFWDGKDFPRTLQASFDRSPRIVGGTPVNPAHSANYIALLNVNFPFGIALCGGSILSNRAILTAAHCIHESTFTLVIVGVHNRHVVEPSQHRRTILPLRYVTHPIFNARTLNSNIAILHIDTPLLMTAQVGVVRLPPEGSIELFANENARSLGWGRVNNTGPTSSVLMQAFNMVTTNANCAPSFGTGIVVDSTLCVSTTANGGQGACHADEGGVLDIQRPPGAPMQIGITSFFAPAGCVTGSPIAYTRITSFRSWISTHTVPPNPPLP
jgi:secreted trypsin-like serine protease